MNIDEALLKRVMKTTGAKTKTEAIHHALAEIDRRSKLIELLSTDDFDMTSADWKNAYDESALTAEEPAARVAEKPTARYGRKSRPRG